MARKIARLGLICSFVLSVNTGFASSVSDLLITEVMANPAALSDTRGEWFELHNPTDREINLRGFSIGDDGVKRHSFDTDLLIMPGEFLTLARSSNPGFIVDYVYDNFTLANSGDEIVLRDGLFELLRLDYGSGFAVAGHSRELLQLPMLASNYGLTLASLSYGSGDIGTPGAAGGALPPPSAIPLPAAAWLFISGILAVLSPSAFSRFTRNVVPTPPNVIPANPNINRVPLNVIAVPTIVIPAQAGRSDASVSQRLLPTIPNSLNFFRFNRSHQS